MSTLRISIIDGETTLAFLKLIFFVLSARADSLLLNGIPTVSEFLGLIAKISYPTGRAMWSTARLARSKELHGLAMISVQVSRPIMRVSICNPKRLLRVWNNRKPHPEACRGKQFSVHSTVNEQLVALYRPCFYLLAKSYQFINLLVHTPYLMRDGAPRPDPSLSWWDNG